MEEIVAGEDVEMRSGVGIWQGCPQNTVQAPLFHNFEEFHLTKIHGT